MLFGYAENVINQDAETLHYRIDATIREVLDDSNIAEIDKRSRSKLYNVVMKDQEVLKGEYTEARIRFLIESELSNLGVRISRKSYAVKHYRRI